MYLAIDPGKTTGYAVFDDEGKVVTQGKLKGEDVFLDFLEDVVLQAYPIHQVIMEAYRNRPNMKNNMRSTNPTSQHEGAISRVFRKRKIPIALQEASPALAIGLKFLEVEAKYKGKHVPDDVSALAHGTYYLRKQKIL